MTSGPSPDTDSHAAFEVTLSAEGESEEAPIRAELVQGEVIGRHVVLARLGSGGMGIVYSAYDPELDRRVALKLLKRSASGCPSAGAPVTANDVRAEVGGSPVRRHKSAPF